MQKDVKIVVKVVMSFLLAFYAMETHAQKFAERLHFEFAAGTGLKSHGISPLDLSFKLNMDIVPITYIFATAEGNLSLFDVNATKTYTQTQSLGGGVGIKLLNGVKSNHALDFRVKGLWCIGNTDWSRSSYDASLAWYMKSERFSPVVELGYRYIDSHSKGIDNYGNLYVSVGIRY